MRYLAVPAQYNSDTEESSEGNGRLIDCWDYY